MESGLLLTRLYRRDCMQVIDEAQSKESVIVQLVQLLVQRNRIDPRLSEPIIRQLLQRERFGSSAIGKGLAIPHVRVRELSKFVGAVGISRSGVDFDSIDREPTKLIFLTLTPLDQRNRHIQLLSRLANLVRDKRLSMRLVHAISPDDVFEFLADIDGEELTNEATSYPMVVENE